MNMHALHQNYYLVLWDAKRYMIFIDINVQVKCHLIINTRFFKSRAIISILYIVFLDIYKKTLDYSHPFIIFFFFFSLPMSFVVNFWSSFIDTFQSLYPFKYRFFVKRSKEAIWSSYQTVLHTHPHTHSSLHTHSSIKAFFSCWHLGIHLWKQL